MEDVRPDRVINALRTVPMFRGLSPTDQARVAGLATIRDYSRGDFVWHEGDEAANLTIILNGQVKIVRHAESGDVILEIFGPGEPVGAIAVYNYMPYPASGVCLEPTTLLVIPRRDYFELLDRHPEFARAIIRELTRLTISLVRKVQEMRGARVENRIAQLFLTLADRMGVETENGVEIRLQLSRQEIAEMVGTTVETAIRVMSRWGRENVLVTGQRRFVIPSRERLRAVLEGADGDVAPSA